MSIKIESSLIRNGLAIVKIVRPVTGDFSIQFVPNGSINFTSIDKRRSITAKITHGDSSDIESEYFISLDRVSILENDLKNVSLSEGDKGLTIKYSDGDTSRSTVLKRRSSISKRPVAPNLPSDLSWTRIPSKLFDAILKQSACSALVKETQTEEDMRINQIHFYKDNFVTSNARFYGTQVASESIDFDMSLVSADIPYIRNLCARCKSDILIAQDESNIFIQDDVSRSWMHVHKVPCVKPSGKLIKIDESHRSFTLDSEVFKSISKWLSNSLDSTQRVTFKVSADEDGYLFKTISVTGVELTSNRIEGSSEWSADFPISVIQIIADHLLDGPADIYFDIPDLLGVLVVGQKMQGIIANHFLRSMKPR